MNAADRVRVLLGLGVVSGCVSHFGWLWANGSLLYHGPSPAWAVWFWFGVCAVDLVVFWLVLAHPHAGVAPGVATMATTLVVNWTLFPTFEYGFNWVLIGLTVFGVIVFAAAPWLWRASRWRLSQTS
jgi:hypothetical protein